MREYENTLHFIEEHPLSTEALKIDVLVIKMKKEVKIKKNIGKIFRKVNVVEFKSEKDYVSINDYYKVVGYSCLCKAFENVSLDQVTVTFFEYKVPKKLFKHLKEERGLSITEPYDNIFYIHGELFPIQIIVNNARLSENEYVFIRNLRSGLSPKEMYDILHALEQEGYTDRRLKYIDVLLRANSNIVKEVSGMFALEKSEGFKILADAFAEHYKEKGWLPEFMNEILAEELAEKDAVLAEKDAKIQDMQNTLIEQAKEMLKDGFPVDLVIKYNKLPRETIESLADMSESDS